MATALEFIAAARAEFDQAFDWYAERSVGAALGFATAMDVAVESIAADPGRFVHTYSGCRLCRMKRYPYCVIFQLSGDTITVVAVAHAKRRPGYWRNRA